MPGRAKSELEKSLIARCAHDDLMSRAVNAYNLELKKPYHQRHGLRRVCLDFEKLNYEATGTYIKLSHATLRRLADGGKPLPRPRQIGHGSLLPRLMSSSISLLRWQIAVFLSATAG